MWLLVSSSLFDNILLGNALPFSNELVTCVYFLAQRRPKDRRHHETVVKFVKGKSDILQKFTGRPCTRAFGKNFKSLKNVRNLDLIDKNINLSGAMTSAISKIVSLSIYLFQKALKMKLTNVFWKYSERP